MEINMTKKTEKPVKESKSKVVELSGLGGFPDEGCIYSSDGKHSVSFKVNDKITDLVLSFTVGGKNYVTKGAMDTELIAARARYQVIQEDIRDNVKPQ